MNSIRLTDERYWDDGYNGVSTAPLAPEDYRHLNDRRLVELLESLTLTGKHVLEVGAGNSAVLTHLARRHGDGARFSGLDYSERGCRLLARRAEREGVTVGVLHQDLFEPAPELLDRFDIVFSLGVVEHFSDLAAVLRAQARLVAPGGLTVSLIPNMAGILGTLTRRFNREVFDLHVAHDLGEFVAGHRRAGLTVLGSGYLCSTNFGVLSSCFSGPASRGFGVYLWLSRLTKLLWWVESRLGDLPHTKVFSPYLYVVSRRDP